MQVTTFFWPGSVYIEVSIGIIYHLECLTFLTHDAKVQCDYGASV